jgi:tetratricopeptide (TPR) repeat protein
MDNDLAQKAVNRALAGDWENALKINKKILKDDTKDIDALNRIARAHAELGNLTAARKAARKVLAIDHFNTIAKKSLEKWRGLKKGETLKSGPSSAKTFIEEPGKTKIVGLLHICDAKLLAKLDAGDKVAINTHGHRVTISTLGGKYIGKLPDDLSAHIRKLIKYGNKYEAFIKSIEPKDVKVFIREIERSERLADIPSFSTEKIEYISFTPPELVHKKEDIVMNQEEEE